LQKARNKQFKETMKNFGWTVFAQFITLVHFVVDKLVALILEMVWGDRKNCPKLDNNQFISKSAVELAGMIRKKEITSHQVVKAYIDRIAEINPSINAIFDGPFLEALDEAKAIDEKISAGLITEEEFVQKPFLGNLWNCLIY
jgi:fatty acid amide hydrolase 2